MDDIAGTQPSQEVDTDSSQANRVCSIPDYRASRQDFFAAIEEYRTASEEYLDAVEAYQQHARHGGTSDELRLEHDMLQEKMQKSEAALKMITALLELAKARGEAVQIDV